MITLARRARGTLPCRGDDGSMLLALLLTIIVTGLLLAVTVTVISGQVKTRSARDFNLAGQAADAAVNDVLIRVNTSFAPNPPAAQLLADHDTPAKAFKCPATECTGDDMKWEWYAEDKALGKKITTGAEYTVYATGYRKSPTEAHARTVKITLVGMPVTSGSVVDGSVAYTPAPGGGFSWAAFADSDLILRGDNKVTSYNSATSQMNTGAGTVGSNGVITLDGGAVADRITLADSQANPDPGRCQGLACAGTAAGGKDVFREPVKVNVGNVDFIETALGQCKADPFYAGTLKTWRSSTAATPGVLSATGSVGTCYASLDFDRDTTINGSPGAPAVIYVEGDITIRPGVTVNVTGTAPQSASLIIYSKGRHVTLRKGATGDPTQVAWALWAPNADCASDTDDGEAALYGSTVCNRITSRGGFDFFWDQQLALLVNMSAGDKRVWSVADYVEQ